LANVQISRRITGICKICLAEDKKSEPQMPSAHLWKRPLAGAERQIPEKFTALQQAVALLVSLGSSDRLRKSRAQKSQFF
jgi:hypothetical protein